MSYRLEHLIDRVKFTREAMAVRRCHTVPIIGEHQVGSHTCNMLHTLRQLWPKAPLRLVWAILEHDVPERLTGDIPSPAKKFGAICDMDLMLLERNILIGIYGEDISESLDKEELKWLIALDVLDLYMLCKDQDMLGNRNVHAMMRRIEKFFRNNQASLASAVVDLFWQVRDSEWEMMPDLGDE